MRTRTGPPNPRPKPADRPRFQNWQPPEIRHNEDTKWGWRVLEPWNLLLGENTDIGYGTLIVAGAGVEIQEGCQLGSHCSIYSINTIDGTKGKVTIKKGARVGTHSTIFPGVTIGENALVGAYSLVKNDVPDNAIVMGIPARRKEGDGTNSIRGRWVRAIGICDSPGAQTVGNIDLPD